MFAALNSVEIWIQQLASLDFFHAKEDWTKEWRPQIEKLVRDRLGMLEKALDGKDYLEEKFTVGDLIHLGVPPALPGGPKGLTIPGVWTRERHQ